MLPKNPYIVNAIGFHEYKEDPHIYILMEVCDRSLHEELQINNGLNVSQFKSLIRCFVNGFTFLHQYNIVHGDIKPGNILILNGKFKLADFGLSFIAPPNTRLSKAGGSFSYSHLSVFKMNFWSKIGIKEPKEKLPWGIDLYSTGVTLYESITCKLPFRASSYKRMYKLISNKKQKHIRGVEVDGQYCYFSWLPCCSIKNEKIQKAIQSMILSLLAHEEDKMTTFKEFYEKCEQIIKSLDQMATK